ncbi:MAG: DHA2 family efflux MFS transporter permease subunit [Candidatus Tectomicrobia bacterium]|nr:DHA2 family efflux MFS transporter permease subunit [Candidatus Tectomicrobia bacterium]
MRVSIAGFRKRRVAPDQHVSHDRETAWRQRRAAPRPVPQYAPRDDGTAYKWWVGGIIILATIIFVMSFEAMSLALPTMMVSMRVGLREMSWTLTGYMISRTLFVGAVGWLGNRLGNRNLFALSLAVFTVGSLLCALAWSFEALVLFRIVQGMGAGPLMPLIMIILHETFPPHQRGLAQSLFMVGDAAGSVLGRGLVGYLIDAFGWRSVFYINVPLGVVALGALLLVVPNRRETQVQTLDPLGLCFLAGFVVCLLIGLQSGAQDGWAHTQVRTLLLLATMSLIAFIVSEMLVSAPLIDLRLFRRRSYSLLCVVNCGNITGLMGAFFLTPLMLQRLLGLTPIHAGLVLIPGAIAWGVIGVLGGKLSDRIDARLILLASFGATIWTLLQLNTVTLDTPASTLMLYIMYLFCAMALSFTPINVMSMRTLPDASLRVGMSMMNLVRGLAAVVAVAVLSLALEHRQLYHMQLLAQEQSQNMLEVQPVLDRLHALFYVWGDRSEMAEYKAMATLNQRLHTAAVLRAYQECYIGMALIYMVLFLPVVALQRRYAVPVPALRTDDGFEAT